jgi:hypothetical protein
VIPAALAATAVSLATLALGCGSGGRTFTAEEFVEEANANGAGLELGDPLFAAEGEDEIYRVALQEGHGSEGAGEGPASGETDAAHEHGGGSLRVSEDAEAAEEEYARCESAASLLCYRAANIVLILEPSVEPQQLRGLDAAIRAMESS